MMERQRRQQQRVGEEPLAERTQALRRWQILADAEAKRLPFGAYHADAAGPETMIELLVDEGASELDGLGAGHERELGRMIGSGDAWGEDSAVIESWFSAGEDLELDDFELLIEETQPARWERALHWVCGLSGVARWRAVAGKGA